MKSISILGCGWLGKPLAVELIKSGYQVSGSTTQESKAGELESLGIKPFLIKFDPQLSSGATAHREFFKADTLIISIPPRRKSGQTDVYLEQMNNAVQEVLKGSISNVLFISSTSVYTDGDRIVTERDADPTSYLVEAENILRNQTKFKTTVIRFGGLVGPGRNPGRFLAGKRDVQGSNHPVNVIHQQDCIGVIKAIIEQQVWGEVFNACADHHPTRKEFYTRASAVMQLEAPEFLDADVSRNKIVSCDKLKLKLKCHFIHNDLFEMLDSFR
ncbi:MAG: SDR family oxidoreductase [Chryseolinea sp.]